MQNIENALAAIEALDVTGIKLRLQQPAPHGKGWAPECCDQAVMWYKRFLTIRVKYPNEGIVPNDIIDEVWHTHITDTVAYAKDCEVIFGKFLHHNPYFGMGDGKAACNAVFARTNELYEREFGEDCTSVSAMALWCLQEGHEPSVKSDSALQSCPA